MSNQEDSQEDPLRQRVAGNVRFRDDDPPEVREALMRNAMQQELSSARESLDYQRPSEKR